MTKASPIGTPLDQTSGKFTRRKTCFVQKPTIYLLMNHESILKRRDPCSIKLKRLHNMKQQQRNLLSRFEEHLLAFNKAESTIDRYLKVVEEYLEVNLDLDPFEKEYVRRYLAEKRRQGYKGNTLRNRFYIVKAFFNDLEKPWPLSKEEVPDKSTPEQPMFTLEEMTRMEATTKKRGPRDYALIMLENTVGLRRIEIRNLNIGDYNRPWLLVRTGKKGRVVRRELDPSTCDALDAWIRTRRRRSRQIDPDALFIRGTHGPRLSLGGLRYIIRSIREEAGIDKSRAGFHATRRRVMTDLHESGFSAAELTEEWGWEDPSTVQTYIKLSKRKVEEKLRRVHRRFRRQRMK